MPLSSAVGRSLRRMRNREARPSARSELVTGVGVLEAFLQIASACLDRLQGPRRAVDGGLHFGSKRSELLRCLDRVRTLGHAVEYLPRLRSRALKLSGESVELLLRLRPGFRLRRLEGVEVVRERASRLDCLANGFIDGGERFRAGRLQRRPDVLLCLLEFGLPGSNIGADAVGPRFLG